MKSTICWDVTPCSRLNVNRRLGGTYRIHLQGRISRARYLRETGGKSIVPFGKLIVFILPIYIAIDLKTDEDNRWQYQASSFLIHRLFSAYRYTQLELYGIQLNYVGGNYEGQSPNHSDWAGTLWTVLATSLMNELSTVQQYVILLEPLYISIYVYGLFTTTVWCCLRVLTFGCLADCCPHTRALSITSCWDSDSRWLMGVLLFCLHLTRIPLSNWKIPFSENIETSVLCTLLTVWELEGRLRSPSTSTFLKNGCFVCSHPNFLPLYQPSRDYVDVEGCLYVSSLTVILTKCFPNCTLKMLP
jgi:hypothetical protein